MHEAICTRAQERVCADESNWVALPLATAPVTHDLLHSTGLWHFEL